MKLVENHVIVRTHKYYKELDHLCFLSKNLYNATLYEVRQHYFRYKKGEEEKSYLNYNAVNKKFTDEKQADYIALPRKVSKWTQKLVDQDMRSFFALLKKKQSGKYDSKVKLPKYADKVKGRKPLHYEKGALSFVKEGYIKLSQTEIYIKTERTKKEVKFVKVTPCNGYIVLSIGYETPEEEVKKNQNYAAIDLGVNNLAAVSSNVFAPFLINGKPIKSINQYYNKKKAQCQSLLPKNQHHCKKMSILSRKRKYKIEDYFHKSTNLLVNHFVSNKISLVVIGRNKEWKQDTNMGKRNNQNFVQIPFHKFISILTYKCKKKGITVVLQEESYTSKCSFLDNEKIGKHSHYVGKRIKRGLFLTGSGLEINADINGSLNILKKYLSKNKNVAWNDQIWSDCVEVCSEPYIEKINIEYKKKVS